jgi:predicted transcriptional regulator
MRNKDHILLEQIYQKCLSESEDISIGININDKIQDFTGQILRGEKTIETRNTNSLKPYIGKTVGIIRTGKGKAYLVGYCTIGEPKIYNNEKEFNKDYDKHLVSKDSEFYIKPNNVKFGYPLTSIVKLNEPQPISSKGIISRKI